MSKELKAFVLKRKIEKTEAEYEDLDLMGYSHIADDAAKLLETYEGIINLDDLVELSATAATSLAKSKSSISLESLTEINTECALALSQHEGFISLGVIDIDDDVAEALASGPVKWKLTKLRALASGDGSVKLAQKISNDGLIYALYALETVSDEVSAAVQDLSKYKN